MKPMEIKNTAIAEALQNISAVCGEYHLYSKYVNYKPDTLDRRAGAYAVVSIFPIPDNVDPIKIIERNERHGELFYPKDFAIKLHGKNMIAILNELTDYCRNAEFVATIFSEYRKEIPEKMRRDELYPLIDFNEGAYNPDYPERLQRLYKTKLMEYFQDATPTKGFDKKWKEFYRSEKYNENESYFKNLMTFRNRGVQNVSLEVLFKGTAAVKKVTIPEHDYQRLIKYLKECYPDVMFHADEKWVIDHGMMKDADGPFGKTITHKEYCDILERDFAEKQFDAIKHVKPSYFEYREIYYKESDEAIIASAYNSIRLRYAKPDPIEKLKQNGEINVVSIPDENFMNFVSLAKANQIPFSLDNRGRYSTPSFELVSVVYNTYNEQKIKSILNRIAVEKVKYYHAIVPEQEAIRNQTLRQQISAAENKKIELQKEEKDIERKYSEAIRV